jgi:D-alanyl-D-alanine carboxypeptidase
MRLPAIYATDDPETDTGDPAPGAENGGADAEPAPEEYPAHIKSPEDLMAEDSAAGAGQTGSAPPEGEPAVSEIPAAPMPEADSDTDTELRRLHDKALKFANGRTGLIGLFRRFRDVALAAAAKVFTRSKKSVSKGKAKLNISKDVDRAFSGDGEKQPSDFDAGGEAAADGASPEKQPESAKASEAQKKRGRKPSAKSAKVSHGSMKSKEEEQAQTPPADKAAAKKLKDKEKAAAKKVKDAEKKTAKKAKDDAKKAAKLAKEEAKKAAKEAKEAAFAEKYPKKAAKRAEQAAKKDAKKAKNDAKKKTKPDKGAAKAAKASAKAAKKAKKDENRKPKLTKDEKFQLKLDKQTAKHEKRIAKFEKKAQKINQKLEKKRDRQEAIQEKKNEHKAILKEQHNIRKERKQEIKKQKKYWLEKGVGRAKRNASIISLVVLIIAAFATGTTFLYKSDSVNIPILDRAVQAVADSPVMSVIKFLDKPAHIAIEYASIPVSYVLHLIQGEPKIEEMYFFEADKMERYEAFKEANPGLSSDEIVWRVNSGVDLNFYQNTVKISDLSKKPILINKFHNIDADYTPGNMAFIPGSVQMQADADAVKAFARMQEAAAAENIDITVASAYRSFEYENLLYNPAVSDTREKPENPLARPGFSENQSGLALDLSAGNGRMYDFANTKEAGWVAENAEKYGFILRYPYGMEDITGFKYQPWHIRYVGDDTVKTMQENNISTLEEYCVKFVDHKPGDKPEKLEKESESSMTEGTDGPI